jgi:hypothetical protein
MFAKGLAIEELPLQCLKIGHLSYFETKGCVLTPKIK